MEDWALIRHLHRSEGLSQRAIARQLGIARDTVAAAVASDGPTKYERTSAPSAMDAVEPRIGAVLSIYPQLPATVLAERVGWTGSISWFRERDAVRQTGKQLPHLVGQVAVGVYLEPRQPKPKISAHFHPAIPARQLELLQKLGGLDPRFAKMPTVSTPFVLKPGMIWGPSIGNPGGWSVMGGGPNIEYEYTGFNMTSEPGGAFLAAQPRRSRP
ncbi:hypothetical protein MSIM_43420 [Mycobacterium simiae]|nr:hypothetical protein MSIM_43420 [Mycobacterium simiae]